MSKSRKKLPKKAESDLTQQEREKIIEVLLSQERVLTLLYDKTFPPKISESNQVNGSMKQAVHGMHEQRYNIYMPQL
jgi:hypothetical protein